MSPEKRRELEELIEAKGLNRTVKERIRRETMEEAQREEKEIRREAGILKSTIKNVRKRQDRKAML